MKFVMVIPNALDLAAYARARAIARVGTMDSPLGALSVATIINKRWEVKFFDNYLQRVPFPEIAERLLEMDADVYGYFVTALNVFEASSIVSFIRKKKKKAIHIAGGPQAAFYPADLFSFDCVVSGEAEEGILMLMDMIEKREDLPKLFRCYPVNLEKIPIPDRSLLGQEFRPTMTLNATRGCRYSCLFCSTGGNRRVRPVKVMDEEIRYLISLGARKIYFREEDLVSKDTLKEFLEGLSDEAKGIPKLTYASPASLDEEALKMLKELNFESLHIGVESGSEKTLKRLKRGYTVNKARKLFDLLHKYGFNFSAGFMIGFPWEERGDIQETFRLAMTRGMTAYLQRYVGLPSSELYRNMPEKLIVRRVGSIFISETHFVKDDELAEWEALFPNPEIF